MTGISFQFSLYIYAVYFNYYLAFSLSVEIRCNVLNAVIFLVFFFLAFEISLNIDPLSLNVHFFFNVTFDFIQGFRPYNIVLVSALYNRCV